MSFFKGLLFGSTVGGLSALLFAPRKGSETLEKWTEPIKTIVKESQDIQADYQQVSENLEETQIVAATLLPTFQKEMTKEIEAFKFQAAPRLSRISEQLQTLQQHLDDSPFNQAKK